MTFLTVVMSAAAAALATRIRHQVARDHDGVSGVGPFLLGRRCHSSSVTRASADVSGYCSKIVYSVACAATRAAAPREYESGKTGLLAQVRREVVEEEAVQARGHVAEI